MVEEALKRRAIKVHSVQSRAKDAASLGKKSAEPSESDPARPKYDRPLEQITDLAGVRVITYFPSTLAEIDEVLNREFLVFEKSNKGADLIEEERFGYQSIHYLVKLAWQRSRLPEYERFADATAEVQVRTILQHAWAEIEHDIQYKSSSVIPTEIRRRFMALAGMFEIADREFQGIQDADVRLTAEARSRVEAGQLNNVEITPDALKAFLDQRIGPDGRISEYSYDWTARLLKRLGFRTLEQVEKCIRGYNDDQLSRLVAGARQGQTTRFEYMLLAGMGENYLRRHIFSNEPWWGKRDSQALATFRSEGVDVRGYDPTTDVPEATTSGETPETVIQPTDGTGVVQTDSKVGGEAE
jgi:putative GTP pyrophosphokinase